jgi:mevalonate kinase
VEFVGCGWAKLLLFGEHAAVYGYPAVGLSLNAALRVHLKPGSADSWRIEGVQAEDREKILQVMALIEELASTEVEKRRPGGRLMLESRIPRGLGFGSSASLCVALAAAVASRRGESDSRRIWEWAHRAERLFHGTPSGIDTGLALLGGLYSFRPDPPQLPEAERLTGVPLHLVVGAVPRRASAGALIGALREKVVGGDQGVRKVLERLGALAADTGAILRFRPERGAGGSAARDLGALAREAQELLGSLGLSTPQLDRLLREGQANGALGGKLSGAGGGGAFFLVCADAEAARGAAAALQQLSRSLKLPTAGTIYPLSWLPDK